MISAGKKKCPVSTAAWVAGSFATTGPSSIPPVENGRAPYRSESQPDAGAATMNPAVSGSMKIPAHSGVLSKL